MSTIQRGAAIVLLAAIGVMILAAGPVNSASSGPVGDGKADDTAAIQKMLDAGGEVRLPRGEYRITQSLLIDLDKAGWTSLHGGGVATLVMHGPGPAVRIVGTHDRSANPKGFDDRVWQRQRMPLIDGVGITAEHDEADGIEAAYTMQLTITRVHIRHCRHAIRLVKNNRNVVIANAHLYDNRGVGVYLDDVNLHQINITGSHISYNDGGGIVSRAGNVRNLHIAGCDLESNMGADREPTANVLIDCTNSRYGTGEVAITGCTIQHNHQAPDSANIRIFGRSEPTEKQSLVREGHVTITGNVLSDVQTNVHLRDCRGVTMTGNTMWMGFDHNLLIERCASVVMGANSFDRNPRYAYGDSTRATNRIVLRDSEDCTISGLHAVGVHHAEAAVTIDRCRRMNMSNGTILDCDGIGLLLKDVSDSRVAGWLIRDDRDDASSRLVSIIGGRGNHIDSALLEMAAHAP